MLAEIFLIKMEAILRTSTESASADNSRFVPITLVDKEGLLDRAARRAPERTIAESCGASGPQARLRPFRRSVTLLGGESVLPVTRAGGSAISEQYVYFWG